MGLLLFWVCKINFEITGKDYLVTEKALSPYIKDKILSELKQFMEDDNL